MLPFLFLHIPRPPSQLLRPSQLPGVAVKMMRKRVKDRSVAQRQSFHLQRSQALPLLSHRLAVVGTVKNAPRVSALKLKATTTKKLSQKSNESEIAVAS
jgi:hypothetical protein